MQLKHNLLVTTYMSRCIILEMQSIMENRLMVNNTDYYLSLCSHSDKIRNTYLNTHTFLTPAKNMYSNVVNPLHGLA